MIILWAHTCLWALFLICGQVHSTVVDMGTCGCVCGENSDDDPAVVTKDGATSNFYNRIRGPKGDTGRTGKLGPEGPPGPPGVQGQKGEKSDHFQSAKSCFHILQSGEVQSGIYTISPAEVSSSMEVFCEMEVDGGGWTLVASVHENNLHGKCSVGDRWSSEQGEDGINYSGLSNWENYNTFGTAEGATSDDYKSHAYHNLPASDIMIWHVPNDVPIREASSRANLKYYTETGFLQDYGGNLRTLFQSHYPLKRSENKGGISEKIKIAAAEFNRSASAIRSLVPGFFSYVYDGVDYISDGGSDMFDSGNMVYYQIGDGPDVRVKYNVHYRNASEEVNVLATTSHPFHVIMWIGNEQRTVPSFSLKVMSGTGADGSGSSSSYSGSLSSGYLQLKYFSYNVYDASDPSITEVFYYISNTVMWGSIAPSSFIKSPWVTTTDGLENGVRAIGNPKSILMGYMLLSKSSDTRVTDSEVRAVLGRTMNILSERFIRETTDMVLTDSGSGGANMSLVQPIRYITGNNDTVMNRIPPEVRSGTTPGFIQFRPFAPNGLPNAICPGIKTENKQPQSICIGGINSYDTDKKSCGDFSGWDGMPGDSPSATAPDGYARSTDDQQSSILIFTRKRN